MQNSSEKFYKKLFGKIGEDKAVKYLKQIGYKIIERNYSTKIGEIDIIAKDKDCIVFIEVKNRKNDKFGKPSEAVDYRKQNKYFMVSNQYLIYNNLTETECRFDIIEIEKNEINHIKNAFYM